MSYGIEITGNNGVYQINSDVATKGLQVSQKGTGSSVNNISDSDLIYVRRASNTFFIGINGIPAGTSVSFVNEFGNSINVDYIIAQPANDISVPSGADYGAQVFNSSGVLAFDSRRFLQNSGIEVISFQQSGASNGTLLTSNKNNYIEIGWSFSLSLPFEPNPSVFAGIRSETSGYSVRSSVGPLTSEIAIGKAFTT